MVLVEDNIGLVYKVFVDKFKLQNRFKDDLIQSGSLGLIYAVNNFKEGKGIAFSSFAYKYIYFYMLNHLNNFEYKEEYVLLESLPEDCFYDSELHDIETKDHLDDILSVLSVDEQDFMRSFDTSTTQSLADSSKFRRLSKKIKNLYARKSK